MVCSDPPEGRARWTVRLWSGGSRQTQIGSSRRKGNHPHSAARPRPQAVAGKKCGAWRISNDDYIAKMEDVLETYERPYNPDEPVVCSGREARLPARRCSPRFPGRPGREARRDNEYERRGHRQRILCGRAKSRAVISPSPRLTVPAFEFARCLRSLAATNPRSRHPSGHG